MAKVKTPKLTHQEWQDLMEKALMGERCVLWGRSFNIIEPGGRAACANMLADMVMKAASGHDG
jgi:hypothetical protein